MTITLKGLKNCWLSPAGLVVNSAKHFFPQSWHNDLALCILRDKWNMNDIYDVEDKISDINICFSATDMLEEKGWVRLQTVLTSTRTEWIVCSNKKLTSKAKKVIQDWCIANDTTYEKSLWSCWI